jgi:hypothetical protein
MGRHSNKWEDESWDTLMIERATIDLWNAPPPGGSFSAY